MAEEPEEPAWPDIWRNLFRVFRAELHAMVTWLGTAGVLMAGLTLMWGQSLDPLLRKTLVGFAVACALVVLSRILMRAGWVGARDGDQIARTIRALQKPRLVWGGISWTQAQLFWGWRTVLAEGATISDAERRFAATVKDLDLGGLTEAELRAFSAVYHDLWFAKVLDRTRAAEPTGKAGDDWFYTISDYGRDVVQRLNELGTYEDFVVDAKEKI